MTAAIAAAGLTKVFGSVRAVDDVDLEVHPGEVVGFLGPNGAGKSTAIRLLLGLLRPTSGTGMLDGLAPTDPASRRRVGYLPGDLQLDARRTGSELLAMFASLRGGVSHSRIDELCERFSVDPSRRVGTLSRGNRQKLGVVQAFMGEPDILVLDEPTSGLDPIQQASFAALVEERRSAGAAVLLSSHVLPEVEQVADRVAIIRAGRIVARDTIEALHAQARQHLSLVLAADGASAEALGSVPGVVSAAVSGRSVEVTITGSVQPLLDAVEAYGVVRIRSHDEDLDDVFLPLYTGEADS